MSKRTLIRMAAALALAVGSGGLLRASAPDYSPAEDVARQHDEREALSYLAPPPPPARWAFLQGAPADGGRRGSAGPRGGPRGPGAARGFNGPTGRGPRDEGRPPFPPRLLERLRGMKPEDRERVLQNNPRFRELSAERKAELLQRLNMLLDMDENQRRQLDRSLSALRNLSPEQRRRARRIYENHWRTLSPQRRMAILEEFRHLRDMTADDRGKRLASDDYQTQFSAEERALLSELAAL